MSKTNQKITVFFLSIIVGLMIFYQYRAYEKIGAGEVRESESNIFRIINIYLKTNQKLKSEIGKLEEEIIAYQDEYSRLKTFEKTINQNRVLAGEAKVYGPGIQITFTEHIGTTGLVDLMNELWSVGAEVIAINGLRLTEDTAGFANYGIQVTLNGIPLTLPLTIEMIGPADSITRTIEQPGGILSRLQKKTPNLKINIETKDLIGIEAVHPEEE